jgi:hypothetical protein
MASEGNMRNDASVQTTGFSRLGLFCGLLSALALGVCVFSRPCSAQGQDKDNLGLILSGKANGKDVGLPIYPGSTPHHEKSDDSQALRMGLWGGGSGFKMALVKMDSDASPARVAKFYKKALSKYGKVLDCSNPSRAQSNTDKSNSGEALTCGDDKPDNGGMLYKSGTKQNQYIVGIQPNGSGSTYQLVALRDWENEKN